MIIHLFNSSVVSGPETLVIPALPHLGEDVVVVFLVEERRGELGERPVEYAASFGLRTERVLVRSRIDLKAIFELARLLNRLSPRIVHAHDVKASTYLLAAMKSGEVGRFFTVSTHHGVRARSGFRNRLYEWLYVRSVLPRLHRTLVVCSSDRDLLIARGLEPKKVVVHLNGIDRPSIAPTKRQAHALRIRRAWGLAEFGVRDDEVLLGFAGRLAKEKRVDRLLNVLACLKKHGGDRLPKWRLLVFGEGPLEKKLKALAERLALSERVQWMGYRSGLGLEMAGFDLLLSLSDAEGLPINLLEAGWAATPVLATAVDGNLDLLGGEGRAGVLVGVDDSDEEIARRLCQLIGDRRRMDEMGQCFQRRVAENFSQKGWLNKLLQVYSS